MPFKKKLHRFTLISASLLFWLVASLLMVAFSQLYKQTILEDAKEESQKSISLVRANLESFVFQTVNAADSLATIIALNPDLALDNWEVIAKAMVDKSKYIRNVGAAPNNVITHVYPLKGNEQVLGFDMRDRPDQYASAMRAKELQELYLDGPVQLVQGGHALIIRFPIFLDVPTNKNYWGTVSIVLNYDLILQDSGIFKLDDLEIAMRRYYKHLKDPVVFFGNEQIFSAPDFVLPILLPNSRFEIAGSYDFEDLSSFRWPINIIFVIGTTVALGIYISALLLLRALKFARDASLQDELTKLPNRRFFMNYLKQRLEGGSKPDFTLLNIDLNDFKEVNDTYGHDVGDRFLVHVSKLLQSAVRSSDFVARLGGDEFVVILDRISDAEKAHAVVQKIREKSESSPLFVRGKPITPSLSIGQAVCSGCDDVTTEDILVEADKRMYADKQTIKMKNKSAL